MSAGTSRPSARYGLIGAGMMGQEHLRNIALLDDAAAVAIFEPDAKQRALASALAPGARLHERADALIADEAINCILVASPNHHHHAQLKRIDALRPLPVLMEKPLFTQESDAAAVAELAASYPAPVWVAMEYRYMPPIATLIAEAQARTGGVEMLTIREHRFPFLPKVGDWNRFNRNTGGTFVEKCCHFFDLMRLVLCSEPVRVMASAGQAVNHMTERIDGETPDIWDCGYAIVDFESGARAMLELCMFAEGGRWQEEIAAVGRSGKIEAFVPGPTRFWPEALGPAPVAEIVISPRSPQGPQRLEIPVDPALLEAGDHNGATYYQHMRFAEVVRGGAPVEVGLRDGSIAVEMGLAAQRSARTGEAVRLDLSNWEQLRTQPHAAGSRWPGEADPPPAAAISG